MSGPMAGSGISFGRPHASRHVERAVSAAMERAGMDTVMGVVLFLTDDHLPRLDAALRTAARAARCTQIFGCSAMGVFSDEDWTVDSSGAAALVLGNGAALGLGEAGAPGEPLISLATPGGATLDWLDEPVTRLGAIASDGSGRGPFQVWRNGRVSGTGTAQCTLEGVHLHTAVAQGVRPLTAPLEVAEARGFNLVKLGKYPALNVLINSLPPSIRQMERIPLHMLMCGITFGDPENAIDEGRFRLDHIVAANPDDYSVTLADELHKGQCLFWALRDRLAARREVERVVNLSRAAVGGQAEFALLFSCLGRGPGFYGGADRDIEAVRAGCPGMPFIGFYGNGEIAPLADRSHLYSYSAAMGLAARVQGGVSEMS